MSTSSRPIKRALRPISARVSVPGSRSISNRALECAALATGTSRLTGLLEADDTAAMQRGLTAFGATFKAEGPDVTVEGVGGKVRTPIKPVDCDASGSTLRFLTSLAGLADGWVSLTGTERLMQRPLQPLLDALETLHVIAKRDDVRRTISLKGQLLGGEVSLDASASGQFLSSLLMVAPCLEQGLRIHVGPIGSAPFVEMTRRVMESFGSRPVSMWRSERAATYVVRRTGYKAADYVVEPDVMSASYFFAAAAVTNGSVVVQGVTRDSMQGDIAVLDAFEMMGCTIETTDDGVRLMGAPLRGITFDVSSMPDMAPTLAVAACFASSTTTLTGTRTLKDKESDRAAALEAELTKLGAQVLVGDDELTIKPPAKVQPARIATYEDHRIAMAFAVAGLVTEGVEIEDPSCVAKTFPGFFEVFDSLLD